MSNSNEEEDLCIETVCFRSEIHAFVAEVLQNPLNWIEYHLILFN